VSHTNGAIITQGIGITRSGISTTVYSYPITTLVEVAIRQGDGDAGTCMVVVVVVVGIGGET